MPEPKTPTAATPERSVVEHVIPVDGQWHRIDSAQPLKVGHRGTAPEVVMWAETPGTNPAREYRVFITGEVLPAANVQWVGTVQAPSDCTWHVYSRPAN